MDIQHASLVQVRTGRDGRRLTVEDDVLDIVRQLKEISPSLSVNWNEYGEYFSVVETCPDGRERLVTTVQKLTPAVVEHVRMIGSSAYDYVKESERLDREAKDRKDKKFAEEIGEHGEKLYHAMRKDRQVQNRIYLPAGIR